MQNTEANYCKVTKNCSDTADFVLASLVPAQRWAVSSLPAGCLLLAVETGRYQTPKVPQGEGVCKLCHSCIHVVETECHFVMEFSQLQTLGNELFFNNPKKRPNLLNIIFDKFLYILSSESNSQLQ